jgi:hypothetical protein
MSSLLRLSSILFVCCSGLFGIDFGGDGGGGDGATGLSAAGGAPVGAGGNTQGGNTQGGQPPTGGGGQSTGGTGGDGLGGEGATGGGGASPCEPLALSIPVTTTPPTTLGMFEVDAVERIGAKFYVLGRANDLTLQVGGTPIGKVGPFLVEVDTSTGAAAVDVAPLEYENAFVTDATVAGGELHVVGGVGVGPPSDGLYWDLGATPLSAASLPPGRLRSKTGGDADFPDVAYAIAPDSGGVAFAGFCAGVTIENPTGQTPFPGMLLSESTWPCPVRVGPGAFGAWTQGIGLISGLANANGTLFYAGRSGGDGLAFGRFVGMPPAPDQQVLVANSDLSLPDVAARGDSVFILHPTDVLNWQVQKSNASIWPTFTENVTLEFGAEPITGALGIHASDTAIAVAGDLGLSTSVTVGAPTQTGFSFATLLSHDLAPAVTIVPAGNEAIIERALARGSSMVMVGRATTGATTLQLSSGNPVPVPGSEARIFLVDLCQSVP